MKHDSDEVSANFSTFDCVAMCLLLGLVPMVLAFVFIESTQQMLLSIALPTIIVSIAVGFLHAFFRWHGLGVIINMLGNILAHVYLVAVVYFFYQASLQPPPIMEFFVDKKEEAPAQPAPASPSTAQ